MMEFLECKICNIHYDEEEHRPRNAPCGHEWCSACIRELIKDNIFLCPKCRQKNKVDDPDDFPVCFGLMDIIRALKTQNIYLPQKTEPMISGASNADVCKVHHKTIGHRCLKCQRWLCDVCLCSHTELTGCFTISSSTAVKSMKVTHTKGTDELLSNVEEGSKALLAKIQEHNDKIEEITQKRKDLLQQAEEHGKEIQSIQNILEQGKQQTKDIVNYKKHLSATDSPFAVMDEIEIIEEMNQALLSWSIKHLGTNFSQNFHDDMSKALKEHKNAYVEMFIKNQKRHGKLSQQEGRIYFHTFLSHTIISDSICMPFAHLQRIFPPCPSLVFMEFSLGGVRMGVVHLRLDKDLPIIREHMVQLMTGQQGHTLLGVELDWKDDNCMGKDYLPHKEMLVTADTNAKCKGKRGDLMGSYTEGYLQHIYFQIEAYEGNDHKVIGCIESGMDIIQECHTNYSQGVVITDCGLVLEHK